MLKSNCSFAFQIPTQGPLTPFSFVSFEERQLVKVQVLSSAPAEPPLG